MARRRLRAATGLAGITLAALTPLAAIGMMLLLPERQFQLFAIFGIEGVIGFGATVLARGQWRLPPLPLAFALASSATVTTFCLLLFVPEIRTPSLMLLALLPPAVALFLPWGVTVHAGWLLAGAPVLAIFMVASARGAVPAADWFGAGLVLAVSGLASLVGCVGVSSGQLALSEATVKTHIGRVLDKLGVRDRVQAVIYAYESGLVEPGSPRQT